MQKAALVVDTETTSKNAHEARLLGVATYDAERGTAAYETAPCALPDMSGKFVIAQNGKYDAIVLSKEYGKPVRIDFDTMIAAYLLQIDKPRKLETLHKQHFGTHKKDLLEIYNDALKAKNPEAKERKNLPDEWWKEVPKETLGEYAKDDAESTFELYKIFDAALAGGLRDWFFKIEMPVVNILIRSELAGVEIDRTQLAGLDDELKVKHSTLGDHLKFLAGNPDINFNSSKQLQELLFDTFKLKPQRKTKTGFSTDKDVLESLAKQHAFPRTLLEYREIEKLLNTYVGPTLERLGPDNRLHGNFNQALTKTRRFSSDNPNLQNIPSRGKLGQLFKKCFVARKGCHLFIADYSQIELRILAHLSKDPLLLKIFRNNEDMHRVTAEALNISRDFAKTINFSVIYGTTEYGLSDNLGCSLAAAKEYINGFFSKYKGVEQYVRDIQYEAKRSGGWLKTLAGLPLYIGDVYAKDKWKYAEVMRNAVNYPIQGSSQDILKSAVVAVDSAFGLAPVLMVHDELVYEFEKDTDYPIADMAVSNDLCGLMEDCWKLDVPLKVEWKLSGRWEK